MPRPRRTVATTTETVEQVLEQQPDGLVGGTNTTPDPAPETTEDEKEEALVIPKKEFTEADALTLTPAIQAGIKDGSISAWWDSVTISKKASPSKTKAGFRYYIRLEALNTAGAQKLYVKLNAATPEKDIPENATKEQREQLAAKGMCDYANYGLDLERRQTARGLLYAEMEGPEKLVRNAVKNFLAMEYGHDEIRTMISNSPKYKGIDGLDKIVTAALAAA